MGTIHLAVLSHPDTDRGRFVQVLHRQRQKVIVKLSPRLVVPITPTGAWNEHAAVQHLGKYLVVALLDLRSALLPALPGRPVRDSPVRIGGLGDPLDALKHVQLGDPEAGDVDRLVGKVRQERRGLVSLVLGEVSQAKQAGDGSATLRPGGRGDRHVARVEQHERAVGEVEAEPIGPAAQAEFVPEVASQEQIRGGPAVAGELGLEAVAHLCKERVVTSVQGMSSADGFHGKAWPVY